MIRALYYLYYKDTAGAPSRKGGASNCGRRRHRPAGPVLHWRVARRVRGLVLAAILVVIVLSSMVAAGLMFRMRAELSASAASTQGDQAYLAAMSGIEQALAVLSPPPGEEQEAEQIDVDGTMIEAPPIPFVTSPALSNPTLWFDNPDLFKNQLVLDDGVNKWYFTIYSASSVDPTRVRNGLTDESSKININTADEATLLRLPGMTSSLVAALLDYRDKDSEPRVEGAEQEYYDTLPQPYTIRNGPLTTLEELLVVKGFGAGVIYGEDANMNTLLEPNEDDGDSSFPPDDNDGKLNMGLYGSATTLSYGFDYNKEGKAKVDINGRSGSSAARDAGVSAQTIRFIEAYRGDGNRFTHPSQLLNMRYTMRQRGNTRGGPPGRGGRPGPPPRPVTLESGVTASDMPLILETFTASRGGGRVPQTGLVNINTAPTAVLAALPGMDEGLAQQIVEARPQLDAEALSTSAWLLTQGLMEADAFKQVAPKLTTRGYQYRMRVIGFGVPSGRYRIFEVVVDLAGPSPRVIYQRDVTRLGLPFPLTTEEEEL
ncbi:MAG: type II secretion system protein GspK [Phycisphaeraceae bacterium]